MSASGSSSPLPPSPSQPYRPHILPPHISRLQARTRNTSMKRSLAISLALLLLCLSSFYVDQASGSVFCDTKCKVRCAKAGYMDRCLRYCGMCCSRCRCVPSGTYGNKDECPCYRDMLSSKKKPKCP